MTGCGETYWMEEKCIRLKIIFLLNSLTVFIFVTILAPIFLFRSFIVSQDSILSFNYLEGKGGVTWQLSQA